MLKHKLHIQLESLLAIMSGCSVSWAFQETEQSMLAEAAMLLLVSDVAAAQLAVQLPACSPQHVPNGLHRKYQSPVTSVQVLQSMPTMIAPPRAVETAPAPWPASPEDEAVLVVPALQELLPLQPAKLAVYKLFTEQVCPTNTLVYRTIP